MPESMAATIRVIATGGEYDTTENGRVEYLGERATIPTDAQADAMLEAARIWYDEQAAIHRDGTGLEALYLRAYELLSKVSLILAIPERIRTAEHVRWAFALVRRDVEEKMRLVTANDRDKDAPVVAMRARIANTCSGGEGVTAGVLYNKLRPRKKEEIDKVVAGMIAAGELERLEVKTQATANRPCGFGMMGTGEDIVRGDREIVRLTMSSLCPFAFVFNDLRRS